ncbi:nitrous oxide reductase accessory protein NosL [Castellaniella sp.]|uniref:nitrous oxide reductase accessory protein NosL n=1 Tax=Castellaniella sp. TaxID=1955812 RepID=UPI003A8DA9D0
MDRLIPTLRRAWGPHLTDGGRMLRWRARCAVVLAAAMLVAACGDGTPGNDANAPPPQAMTDEAVGHYCGMNLTEHIGPKGQILLRDHPAPVWFSTIREVFAYTLLPEEPKAILAIYVQDMGQADADGNPPADAWIDAHSAYYLIESRAVGSMGAPDALPFARRDDADGFAARHGGRVVRFQDMPEDYVLRANELAFTSHGEAPGAPSS